MLSKWGVKLPDAPHPPPLMPPPLSACIFSLTTATFITVCQFFLANFDLRRSLGLEKVRGGAGARTEPGFLRLLFAPSAPDHGVLAKSRAASPDTDKSSVLTGAPFFSFTTRTVSFEDSCGGHSVTRVGDRGDEGVSGHLDLDVDCMHLAASRSEGSRVGSGGTGGGGLSEVFMVISSSMKFHTDCFY